MGGSPCAARTVGTDSNGLRAIGPFVVDLLGRFSAPGRLSGGSALAQLTLRKASQVQGVLLLRLPGRSHAMNFVSALRAASERPILINVHHKA